MKVSFLLTEQVLTTGITIPAEMFYAASVRDAQHPQPLHVQFVAESLDKREMVGAVTLSPSHSFESADDSDYVFIPPMWGAPWRTLSSSAPGQRWLAKQYHAGAKLVATGTGVGHLAMAGLLNNKVSTTHWYYLSRFQKRFPQVRFEDKHVVTHQDGIYCAASINSQTDVILYLIEKHFGKPALSLVERQFMHELKRSFATPFYEPGGTVHHDEVVSMMQSWLRTNYHQPVSMQRMSEVAGQSERQLRRRFNAAIGESPMQYLQKFRLQEAQSLLRETNLSVLDISGRVGFAGHAYFTKTFRQQLHMTPADYRRMVRQKSFSDQL